jgi:hypothetical protein
MGMVNLDYGLEGFTLSSMHPRSAQYVQTSSETGKNRHGRGKRRQRVRAKRGPMTGSARLRAGRPGHPRLILEKKDVDARHKAGHDGGWFDGVEFKNAEAA